MSELETEFSDPTSHFAQAGQLNDPSLVQLRDQIKKVMLPLLIKTFQFKLELSQASSMSSRLQSQKNQRSPEEIIEQLKVLDNDLKILFLWCQSCRSQIQKALVPPEEEQKSPSAPTIAISSPDPVVSKSFSEAMSAQNSLFQQTTLEESPEEQPSSERSPETPPSPPKWWKKWMKK